MDIVHTCCFLLPGNRHHLKNKRNKTCRQASSDTTFSTVSRYLLRKLLQFQSVSEGSATSTAAEVHSTPTGPKSTKGPAGRSADSDQSLETSAKKSASKKKAGSATVGSGGDTKKKLQSQAAKDLLGECGAPVRMC